jgi:hypothetical protein
MQLTTTGRGFEKVEHQRYATGEPTSLVQQSSCIGDYEDSWERPGSSYLWIGKEIHLNRDEVREFVQYLNNWLDTGSLKGKKDE